MKFCVCGSFICQLRHGIRHPIVFDTVLFFGEVPTKPKLSSVGDRLFFWALQKKIVFVGVLLTIGNEYLTKQKQNYGFVIVL